MKRTIIASVLATSGLMLALTVATAWAQAAPMNEHAANANASQKENVLRQRKVALTIDRRAAELHDDRFSGPLPDIGQGLDQDLGSFSWSHDVLLFSLM